MIIFCALSSFPAICTSATPFACAPAKSDVFLADVSTLLVLQVCLSSYTVIVIDGGNTFPLPVDLNRPTMRVSPGCPKKYQYCLPPEKFSAIPLLTPGLSGHGSSGFRD